MQLIANGFYALGLVPLAWLVALRTGGHRLPAAWWWVAWAYAVSFAANTAAHWLDGWAVGTVYPLTQAAFVGAVLLTRRQLYRFLGVMVVVAIIGAGLDSSIPLRTVAWGTIAGLAWQRRDLGPLRPALLVTFGLGCLVWWWRATARDLPSWAATQTVWLVGTVWYCWAAFRPQPFVTYLDVERGVRV